MLRSAGASFGVNTDSRRTAAEVYASSAYASTFGASSSGTFGLVRKPTPGGQRGAANPAMAAALERVAVNAALGLSRSTVIHSIGRVSSFGAPFSSSSATMSLLDEELAAVREAQRRSHEEQQQQQQQQAPKSALRSGSAAAPERRVGYVSEAELEAQEREEDQQRTTNEHEERSPHDEDEDEDGEGEGEDERDGRGASVPASSASIPMRKRPMYAPPPGQRIAEARAALQAAKAEASARAQANAVARELERERRIAENERQQRLQAEARAQAAEARLARAVAAASVAEGGKLDSGAFAGLDGPSSADVLAGGASAGEAYARATRRGLDAGMSNDVLMQLLLMSAATASAEAKAAKQPLHASEEGTRRKGSRAGARSEDDGRAYKLPAETAESAATTLRNSAAQLAVAGQALNAAVGAASGLSSTPSSSSSSSSPSESVIASAWPQHFDALYSHVVLQMPRLCLEAGLTSAIAAAPASSSSSSSATVSIASADGHGSMSGSARGTSNVSMKEQVPMAVAWAVLGSLQDMLTDPDVVTLVREAVSAKMKALATQ